MRFACHLTSVEPRPALRNARISLMLVSYMPLGPRTVSPHFCRREIRRREGLLATDAWGSFVCSAGDGKCKRAAEATVPINGLQAGAALMSGASSVELAPRELRLVCLCT